MKTNFFAKPDLKCPHCGQISRSRIDITSALIAWPITVLYVGSMLYAVRTEFFREFRRELFLYIPFVWLFILAPLFVGLRRGFKIIKVPTEKQSEKINLKKGLYIVATALFIGLFGYYSKDWFNVFIGLVIGIIVYAVYNHFRHEK
jgi:hypothetical protein